MSAQRDYWSKILAKHAGRHTTIQEREREIERERDRERESEIERETERERERERDTYKIISMPQSRI